MNKKCILIVCESGISASLFVSKFIQLHKDQGEDNYIDYASISRVERRLQENQYDVLLLAPQVKKYGEAIGKSIREAAQTSKIVYIKPEDYNTMNISKINLQVSEVLKDN